MLKEQKMSNCDAIIDDVTKTCYANFIFKKEKAMSFDSAWLGNKITKTVPRYDKYFLVIFHPIFEISRNGFRL